MDNYERATLMKENKERYCRIMKAYSITDVGAKRQVNQDYVLCREDRLGNLPNLFVVADGMGGHNAGDLASKTCVETVLDFARDNQELKTPISIIERAVSQANRIILEKAASDSQLEGMGTTFVAATISDYDMYVANIGDSRLYVINDDIRQVTEDHSLVEEMVRNGEIDRKNARFHPNKNIITRALGAAREVTADFFEVNLSPGDIVLLCSDGLSNMIDDQEILDIVKEGGNDIVMTSLKLVAKANEYGGKDNISVIMILME